MSNNNNNEDDYDHRDLDEDFRKVPEINDLFFNNQFDEAKRLIGEKDGQSPLYADCMCYLMACIAGMTGDKVIVAESMDYFKQAMVMFNRYRKPSTISDSIFGLFRKPDYSTYTDLEAHIELMYSEVNFMNMGISFIADQSFMSLIKGARDLFQAYRSMLTCIEIQKAKTQWESQLVKDNFDSGCNMVWGFINLLGSHLPARVIRIVGLFGLDVSRDVGEERLKMATLKQTDCSRWKCSCVLVQGYNFYIEQFFGLGDADLEWMKTLQTLNMRKYPEGAFDLFFAAKFEQMNGHTSKAIQLFEQSISVQNEFIQLQHVAKWDLIWCYAMDQNWRRAAELATELRDNSKWSPATNAYQYACFLYMIMDSEGLEGEMRSQVDKAMASVEPLRTRYGGKTLPPEKFAITMAQRYCNGDKQLTLPALMLFYIWNVYGNCAENPKLMEPLIELIDRKLATMPSGDAEFVLLLLKGVCMRNARKTEESFECFTDILRRQDMIETDTYVAPHAAMELGLTFLDMGNLDEAKTWLEKARDDYTGFLVETSVHLRIHGALQKLNRLKANK